jgi:hypothetical protein
MDFKSCLPFSWLCPEAQIEHATEAVAADWPTLHVLQDAALLLSWFWYLPVAHLLHICVSASPCPRHAFPFKYLPDEQEYDDPPFAQAAQLCVLVVVLPSHGIPDLYWPTPQLVHLVHVPVLL